MFWLWSFRKSFSGNGSKRHGSELSKISQTIEQGREEIIQAGRKQQRIGFVFEHERGERLSEEQAVVLTQHGESQTELKAANLLSCIAAVEQTVSKIGKIFPVTHIITLS